MQSSVTLRLFADFQRLVLRNEARAAEFTAEADRIDDALARADQGDAGDHEIFDKLERDVPSDNVSEVATSVIRRRRVPTAFFNPPVPNPSPHPLARSPRSS